MNMVVVGERGGGSGLGRVATLHSAALERMHCAWQMLAIHFLSHKIEKLFSLIFAEFFRVVVFPPPPSAPFTSHSFSCCVSDRPRLVGGNRATNKTTPPAPFRLLLMAACT